MSSCRKAPRARRRDMVFGKLYIYIHTYKPFNEWMDKGLEMGTRAGKRKPGRLHIEMSYVQTVLPAYLKGYLAACVVCVT